MIFVTDLIQSSYSLLCSWLLIQHENSCFSLFGQITQESSSLHWLDHCLPFSDVRFLSMIEWYRANFSLLSAFICACLILLVSLMKFLVSSRAFFLILSFFLFPLFSLCCFLCWNTTQKQADTRLSPDVLLLFFFFCSFPGLCFPKPR